MKYVALLRGINVGGDNRVPMPELKSCFVDAGFSAVSTYINSGNVLFESSESNIVQLIATCEAAIESAFGFHVVCCIITADELRHCIRNAPAWWDIDDSSKHNAMFVIPPRTSADIMDEVGEAKPEYESVAAIGPILFWSAPIATFGRTRYNNIVGTKAYKSITIRNANTAKKLAELCA